MTAFDATWNLLKFEIPFVHGRMRDDLKPQQARRTDHPGWKTMGFVDDKAYPAPGYFVRPNPKQGLDWYSAINVKPIISRITGVAPDEKFDRDLSDDEIEGIIDQIGTIGLHEGTHIALDPIIQQILDENQPLPRRGMQNRRVEEEEMGDPYFAYPYYQEFGAHTASSDYENRKVSPRQTRKGSRESSKFDRNKHMIQEFPRKRMEEGFTYQEAMADNHRDFHEDGRRFRLRDLQNDQRGRLSG